MTFLCSPHASLDAIASAMLKQNASLFSSLSSSSLAPHDLQLRLRAEASHVIAAREKRYSGTCTCLFASVCCVCSSFDVALISVTMSCPLVGDVGFCICLSAINELLFVIMLLPELCLCFLPHNLAIRALFRLPFLFSLSCLLKNQCCGFSCSVAQAKRGQRQAHAQARKQTHEGCCCC